MINIESMKIDKNNIYVNIIFISIFLIFLDAYEIFSIPISWIGLSFLLIRRESITKEWPHYKYLYFSNFNFNSTNIFSF